MGLSTYLLGTIDGSDLTLVGMLGAMGRFTPSPECDGAPKSELFVFPPLCRSQRLIGGIQTPFRFNENIAALNAVPPLLGFSRRLATRCIPWQTLVGLAGTLNSPLTVVEL